MTPTSLNFSLRAEYQPLAQLVRDLQSVAQPLGVAFFLMGAAARDLMLRSAHGIDTGRKTEDVDFSVMVNDWEAFQDLREGLLQHRQFVARTGPATHRLRHVHSGLPLDVVPFGAIEQADRTIAWPPEHRTVFDCFGLREAFGASVPVVLPGGVTLQVASIPALALLKIAAWHDRQQSQPGKDAGDLLLYLRHYLDCNQLDHAAAEHTDLFEVTDYDHEQTSARLLGRHIVHLLDAASRARVLHILQPQADPAGTLLLARQSGRTMESARQCIAAACRGLVDAP